MLPVAQKPMLYYPLTWLEKSGFKDVIVVVQKQQMKFLTKYFEDFYKGNLQVQFEQAEVFFFFFFNIYFFKRMEVIQVMH